MNPLVFLRPSAPTPEGLPPPILSGVLWVSELIPGVLGGVYKVLTHQVLCSVQCSLYTEKTQLSTLQGVLGPSLIQSW